MCAVVATEVVEPARDVEETESDCGTATTEDGTEFNSELDKTDVAACSILECDYPPYYGDKASVVHLRPPHGEDGQSMPWAHEQQEGAYRLYRAAVIEDLTFKEVQSPETAVSVEPPALKPVREEVEETVIGERPSGVARTPTLLNRLIFDTEKSVVRFDTLDQHKIGRLTKRKQGDGRELTVPNSLINDELRVYLLMHRWHEYKTRGECLEHMSKLGRKFWAEEKRREFKTLTNVEVIDHHVTIQKVVDDELIMFFLTRESPELDRRRRLVKIKTWLSKHTPFFRSNRPF